MKTAITGASGQLGHLIIAALKARTDDSNLVALVRTPEKAADLGIEARHFDYTETPENLAKSLAGIDKLMFISGSEIGKREAQHKNVIEAAKIAGIKLIVYTSLLHADKSTLSLAPEHVATEKMLTSSGINFTLMRNSWYTENYTASVPAAIANGAFVGAANDGKISSAARADYAEAAAIILTSENQAGKVYELAGDTAYTLKDLAAEISAQTGKDIPYKNVTESEYAAILESVGMPAPVAAAYASFDTGAANNDLFDESKTLSKLLGHATTPLATSVKTALAK